MHASIHPSIPRCARARANSSTQFSHQGIRPLTQSKAKQIKGEKQAHIYHFRACVLCISKSVCKRKENGGRGSREVIVCDSLGFCQF